MLKSQVTLGRGRPGTEQANVAALNSDTETNVGDIVGLGKTATVTKIEHNAWRLKYSIITFYVYLSTHSAYHLQCTMN